MTIYGTFDTEKEATEHGRNIIGGAIIQQQNGKWFVFSAKEFLEIQES